MVLTRLALRYRNLDVDGVDHPGAGLYRCFGEVGNLGWCRYEAVHVIRLDLLTGRRKMLIVGKETGLLGVGCSQISQRSARRRRVQAKLRPATHGGHAGPVVDTS